MSPVMACIDGSPSAPAVCDYATWAAQRLDAPLTLLHVLDREDYPKPGDLSGSIGLGSREQLLQELASLDEQRARLAREQGQSMLEAARSRANAAGVDAPTVRQRHGSLVETLRELESEIRLLVIGKRGDGSRHDPGQLLGSHLEGAVRALHRPVLVTPATFSAPRSTMLAFDGSANAANCVERLAASPLLKGLPLHLVMVGPDIAASREPLEQAATRLRAAGFQVQTAVLAGDVAPTLHAYQAEHAIDLLVMGAYGQSRLREWFIGSTTNSLLRTSCSPLLVVR